MFGPKSDQKAGPKRPSPERRLPSKDYSPNRRCKGSHHLDSTASLLNLSSVSSSPSHSSHLTHPLSSNLYFLVIIGILILISPVIFLCVQYQTLQTRVDNLEQRCARYELVFDALQRKMIFPDLSPSTNGDSVDSGLVDLDIASSGKEDLDDSTLDPIKYLARRLSPIVADNGNLSSQDQFDHFVHEVRFSLSLWHLFYIYQTMCCLIPLCWPSRVLHIFTSHVLLGHFFSGLISAVSLGLVGAVQVLSLVILSSSANLQV